MMKKLPRKGQKNGLRNSNGRGNFNCKLKFVIKILTNPRTDEMAK